MTELETALLARVKELEEKLRTAEYDLKEAELDFQYQMSVRNGPQPFYAPHSTVDKRKVLLYKRQHPSAGVREVAKGVGCGKDKAASLVRELKREGVL